MQCSSHNTNQPSLLPHEHSPVRLPFPSHIIRMRSGPARHSAGGSINDGERWQRVPKNSVALMHPPPAQCVQCAANPLPAHLHRAEKTKKSFFRGADDVPNSRCLGVYLPLEPLEHPGCHLGLTATSMQIAPVSLSTGHFNSHLENLVDPPIMNIFQGGDAEDCDRLLIAEKGTPFHSSSVRILRNFHLEEWNGGPMSREKCFPASSLRLFSIS